jgi:maleylpyruvate isomerase
MNALVWTETGTRLFLDELGKVGDRQFAEPTRLPGWTTAHLVAHVHFNAEALRRLVSWAATGVENRMYASPEQRATEISEGAQLDPATLRALVVDSAAALEADLASLTEDAWDATVVTAQGRTIPAHHIPWLRAREVMVHAIDLGSGLGFADLPSDFVSELLVDIVRKRAAGGEGPQFAAWLTGRDATPPTLAPWL